MKKITSTGPKTYKLTDILFVPMLSEKVLEYL